MVSDTSTEVTSGRWLIPEPQFHSFMGLARHVAVAGVGGIFTGVVVGGFGSRLLMRIAGAAAPDRVQGFGTEAGFSIGEVTFGGTAALVIFVGLLTGVVGAVIFAIFGPWMSWARAVRGPVFGVILFGLASATSDVMNPDNIDFLLLKNPVLLVTLILLLFIAFGWVMDRSVRFLDRRFPGVEGDGATANGLYVALAVTGLLAAGVLVPMMFTDGFCDCAPPLGASWSLVVAGIGTAIWWATAIFVALPIWVRGVAAVLGYTGLLGVLMFGLARAMNDAIEIIG